MQIRALESKDLPLVKEFTDIVIGKDYFTLDELKTCLEKSYSLTYPKKISSFVLVDEKNNIFGIRLAYPPGAWVKGKGSKLRPDLWNVPADTVAYFQSLFLADSVQGDGWGPKLSEKSVEVFKSLGAKAIVTHAWKESPGNSSVRYLTKMGFEPIATHKDYWIDVDYECPLDGRPCRCTAEEMIKYL